MMSPYTLNPHCTNYNRKEIGKLDKVSWAIIPSIAHIFLFWKGVGRGAAAFGLFNFLSLFRLTFQIYAKKIRLRRRSLGSG